MSTERLSNILREIADEARPVPLAEAAMARTRRVQVRRTAVAAFAAVVVLAAGIIGTVNVWGGGKGAPDPAASRSSTVPSPSESEETPDGIVPTEYDGTFYYLESFAGGARLLSWRPASRPEVVLTGNSLILVTANVSPDGRWLSWIDERNKLMLRDLATGTQRELMDYDPDDVLCREPTWSITSHQLLVASPEARLGIFDITTDTFTSLGFDVDGCHPRPAERPGGGSAVELHVTYFDMAEQTVVEVDADGDPVAETPFEVPGRGVTDMPTGGGDGEYYCFQTGEAGGPGGDAARGNGCDTVGEPGDPGRVTRDPGAGKLLQVSAGMARKEVDGVRILTPHIFAGELESGEFVEEAPDLAEAWLIAFVPAD
ncbi:hypothetical protein [Phytomonospora endophytica]|uniref:WD40 repeat domain-containing protein n=1 Tax=Phytomonospora endophytica TaxID=714109 RepID=A0A841FYY4_9ACTN|nr:hypothetical protein [Phytomonospora endophytica]MBB6038928.1 hypothetical protein [Phytomonospora endophytica]GIG67970.1 hypothetical protein Pen01_42650 [Phytomonospora endophytica]